MVSVYSCGDVTGQPGEYKMKSNQSLTVADDWNLYAQTIVIGASLSEPHTSMTSLRTCVCIQGG